MALKLAINGFGRIGRLFFRAAWENKEFRRKFNIVAVNDVTAPKDLAYFLKYDSVHRVWKSDVSYKENSLIVDKNKIKILSVLEPSKLPWKDLGVDVVLESTGRFTDKESATSHLQAGAKKVIISAPAKKPDITLVPGVNLEDYNPGEHNIISMGSCTTNALAPTIKVLKDSFGVRRGVMSTIHAYTNDQRVLDLVHKDLRRGRSAGLSIIPTTTGAAKAIFEVIEGLEGKIDGIAFRVPVADASVVDLIVELERDVTKEQVNDAFKKAADGKMKGVLEYTEEPIVSVDVIGNPHTAIVDGLSTMVLGERSNLVKVLTWYDNEWGYSAKLVEMFNLIAGKGVK